MVKDTQLCTGEMRHAHKILARNLKNHVGNLGVDGRIILKWIFKEYSEGTNWIQLAQDRVQW